MRSFSGSHAAGDGAPPPLEAQLGLIARKLRERGQVGLLYVTVLHRRNITAADGWQTFEEVQSALLEFLRRDGPGSLRRHDAVLETATSGNAVLIILGEPRESRRIESGDVARVRARLQSQIAEHLEQSVSAESNEQFACCVGGALMRGDDSVAVERIVYHALEEAFADALSARERASRSEAVQLRYVIESESVRSVYQPLLDITERRVIGYEALTRVPAQRFRNPEQLFKAACENDATWVLERLCRLKAVQGLPELEAGQQLFLNTLPDTVSDPQFHDGTFTAQLERAGLTPERIVLEITEHSEVQDFSGFRRRLAALRREGYQLAMDDVGSGFSSLQSIAEIDPDYIKIDMALVRDIHISPLKQELISTICRFSERTGIALIAEGVESTRELVTLAALGVHCVQGFLLAEPDDPPRHPAWNFVG